MQLVDAMTDSFKMIPYRVQQYVSYLSNEREHVSGGGEGDREGSTPLSKLHWYVLPQRGITMPFMLIWLEMDLPALKMCIENDLFGNSVRIWRTQVYFQEQF